MLEFLFKNAYIIILAIIGLTTFLGKAKQQQGNPEGQGPPQSQRSSGEQMPSFGETDHHRRPQVLREQPSHTLERERVGEMQQAQSVMKSQMSRSNPAVDRTSTYTRGSTTEKATSRSASRSTSADSMAVELETAEHLAAEQARKGMMWAEIFGPPKAKQWKGQAQLPYKRNSNM